MGSTSVDDRSGQPDETRANKIQKPNKKETTIERSNPLNSEIPERLQEFRENLVDDEIPVHGDSHASSSHEVSLEPTFKRREDLGKHSFYTHFPKDRNCEICQRTKITRAPCRRRNGEAVPRAEKFGDLITADDKVLSDNCESRNNHRYAVVVQDLATQWIQAYPCKTKTSQETQRSLQKFLEPERKPEVIYTDNSLEFGKACEDLSWNHCTSTPHRSETNGIAERAVRRVKEGTSAVLLQSGLNESWSADSMECYTYLRYVTDLLSDGKTPYERRFGQPFKGPIIPFGSLVECHPITANCQSRIHQFGKKILPGLFLGYALYAGGFGKVTYWSQTLRSWRRWTHRKSTRKDSMRKRWYFPKKKENLFFQSQMDESKPLEESRTWEHPPWYGIDQFKERVTLTFLENQKGLSSRLTSGCRWSNERFLVHVGETSYTAITLNPESSFTRREKNHSLFHWNTLTFPELHIRIWTIWRQAWEAHRWLLEYRWVSRLVRSLDRFHTIYSIGRKTSRRIYVVRGEINKKTAYIQARSSMARTVEINGKARQAEGEAKVV